MDYSTPYLVVDRSSGKPIVTENIKYLTADEEYDEVIASAASLLDDEGSFMEEVIGRYRGETALFRIKGVTYMDVSPTNCICCLIDNSILRARRCVSH